ncbi:MAG: hypothetical protein WBW51_05310 [Methyloceanibacter sp.]
MPIRIALVVCVLVFGSVATVTAVSAGDPYGGFGPSGTDTPEVNTDPANAVAPDDQQTLPWLQQQSQNQQNNYGAEWEQQSAPSGEYDMDDEGGH